MKRHRKQGQANTEYIVIIGLVAVVATAAAVVFIPIMVRDLLAVGKKGWVVTWIVFVVVPTAAAYLLGPDQNRLLITTFVFLPTSYIYFWMLKLAVDSWVGQLSSRLEYLRQTLDADSAED